MVDAAALACTFELDMQEPSDTHTHQSNVFCKITKNQNPDVVWKKGAFAKQRHILNELFIYVYPISYDI